MRENHFITSSQENLSNSPSRRGGVISSEAPVLGLLEIFKGKPLEKIENSIDLTVMECFNFFKLNEHGHAIGINID